LKVEILRRLTKLLGVYKTVHIDSDLSMSTHVSRTVSSGFYQLRRIKAVRRSLPIEAAKTVINAFIMSRVDYCNGLLPGIIQRQRDRMQSIFNASAKLVYGGSRRDHKTPLVRDKLHWLRFSQRVTYKLCLFIYKTLHNCAPKYIADLVVPVSRNLFTRRLRSADTLCVVEREVRLQFGRCGFSMSASCAWNRLSPSVRMASTINEFRKQLKTELFHKSYS